jgi:hypothetical protein
MKAEIEIKMLWERQVIGPLSSKHTAQMLEGVVTWWCLKISVHERKMQVRIQRASRIGTEAAALGIPSPRPDAKFTIASVQMPRRPCQPPADPELMPIGISCTYHSRTGSTPPRKPLSSKLLLRALIAGFKSTKTTSCPWRTRKPYLLSPPSLIPSACNRPKAFSQPSEG